MRFKKKQTSLKQENKRGCQELLKMPYIVLMLQSRKVLIMYALSAIAWCIIRQLSSLGLLSIQGCLISYCINSFLLPFSTPEHSKRSGCARPVILHWREGTCQSKPKPIVWSWSLSPQNLGTSTHGNLPYITLYSLYEDDGPTMWQAKQSSR